jgi:cytochrome c-type biogenesis protein CcmH
MLEFFLALFTAATVGVLLIPLLRVSLTGADRLDQDLAIYRDQLAEIDRERADGSLAGPEAAAARTEIERRLLVAAERDTAVTAKTPPPAPALHRLLPPALCLLIPALALGVYLAIGQPGVPSAPFIARAGLPASAPADETPDLARQIEAARERLKANPDDPDTLSELGELLTEQTQGTVPQPAVDAFRRALEKQPDDPRAMFYLGLHDAQAGDSKAALTRWLDLEARSPEGAPWLPTLRAEIDRVAKLANIDPLTIKPDRKPPAEAAAPSQAAPGMPQPTEEQREAMAKMSPQERQQAIRGMVDQLAARLDANPGDRDGWLRLANARRVLGEPIKAAEAYARADALAPLDPRLLADWAETWVRQLAPGAPPPPEAVAVLQRLEKADPNNALALFYLGAASFSQGDKSDAALRWKKLLALLPPAAPIRGMLEGKIKEAEGR